MDVTIVDEERGGFAVYIACETDEGRVVANLNSSSEYSGVGGFSYEEEAQQALVQFLEICANTYETSKLEFERNENHDLVMV